MGVHDMDVNISANSEDINVVPHLQLRQRGAHGGPRHGCKQSWYQQLTNYGFGDDETTNVDGHFGTKLAQVGPKLAQGGPKLDPKLDASWPQEARQSGFWTPPKRETT